MNELITKHEIIILGSALDYNPDGIDALRDLKLARYKFSSDFYQEVADYIFDATCKSNAVVNKVDFKTKFSFDENQYDYWISEGTQDTTPSGKYLVDNKHVADMLNILEAGYSDIKSKNPTADDFYELEAKLTAVRPLSGVKNYSRIDADIEADAEKLKLGTSVIYKTGIEQLDKLILGITDESIIVGGGFSGSGKTNIAIQTSLNVLNNSGKVCYLSAENSESQLKTRFASHYAKVLQAAIKQPDYPDQLKILSAVRKISDLYKDNLVLVKTSDFDDALGLMKLMAITGKADFFVLDYIQLFSTNRKGLQEERVRLEDFTTRLIDFSTTFKKPIFVLSQTTESAQYSFKGSQSIRNMATDAFIIFKSREFDIVKDPVNTTKNVKRFKVLVDVIKSRNGIEGKAFCEVIPNDPAIRDAYINYSDKDALNQWKELTYKPKSTFTW